MKANAFMLTAAVALTASLVCAQQTPSSTGGQSQPAQITIKQKSSNIRGATDPGAARMAGNTDAASTAPSNADPRPAANEQAASQRAPQPSASTRGIEKKAGR